MNHLVIFIFHLWKYVARYLYGENFLQTKNVLPSDFVGHYYQIARTPNWFQKEKSLASAVYQMSNKTVNNTQVKELKITNKEYSFEGNQKTLRQTGQVHGTLSPIPGENGTYLVWFDKKKNSQPKRVFSGIGLYRILNFEYHPRLGYYLFVSSFSPKYSWLLWRPPLDKSNLIGSYQHAFRLLDWFSNIGVRRSDIIITSPDDLYKLMEYNEFL